VPEKPQTRREENAHATRTVLIATAKELFGERGYSGAGIEEIAKRAGVTTGALYHHFGNKRGLFRAVAISMEVELLERAIEVGNQLDDSWKGLRAGIAVTLEASLAGDYEQIIVRDARNVLGASEWRAIERQYSLGLLRDVIEAMMKNGLIAPGLPDMVSRMLTSVIRELSISIAEAEDPPAARREADRLIERVLNAIRETS
jgi:AcrR family transcriptional regulator